MIDFISEARIFFPKIVEFRRNIHQNPELSFKEFKTTEFICKILSQNHINFERVTETGVVATIGLKKNCVALRADIDALPIQEETGLPFSSHFDGVMHACGHDLHTSMLLGAAVILKKYEEQINGTIKLIFQPGEEKLPGGAKIYIENGVLENPKPLAIFGQHINPQDDFGNISVSGGAIMASTDEIYITIKGVGVHAAQPHLGNDIILVGSQLINQFQTIISKFRNPFTPAVLSITAFNGGNTTNIFPEEVKLMGTMRTFSPEVRDIIKKMIHSISDSYAKMNNCEIIVDIVEGYPTLINDVTNAEFVFKTAKELLPNNQVTPFEPKMWAEDFAYFAENIPGVFWFIGAKPTELDVMPTLHNPKLNPVEETMINGTALLMKVATDFLDNLVKDGK